MPLVYLAFHFNISLLSATEYLLRSNFPQNSRRNNYCWNFIASVLRWIESVRMLTQLKFHDVSIVPTAFSGYRLHKTVAHSRNQSFTQHNSQSNKHYGEGCRSLRLSNSKQFPFRFYLHLATYAELHSITKASVCYQRHSASKLSVLPCEVFPLFIAFKESTQTSWHLQKHSDEALKAFTTKKLLRWLSEKTAAFILSWETHAWCRLCWNNNDDLVEGLMGWREQEESWKMLRRRSIIL